MPWEKQFDIDTALEKAKDIFWLQGYEATSMQQLLEGMGINRGSFYATFKSKHDVYVNVLKRYGDQNRAAMFKVARQIESPKQAILFIFEDTIVKALSADTRSGCFLANAALEVAPRDAEVGKVIEDSFGEIRRFFEMLIEEARSKGEIPSDKNGPELASALLSLLLGLKVLARSSPNKTVLEASLKQARALLE